MTPPPWELSGSAVVQYAFACKWAPALPQALPDGVYERAERALLAVQKHVQHRQTNAAEELWRASRAWARIWIVVSNRTRTPTITWVGFEKPPPDVFRTRRQS